MRYRIPESVAGAEVHVELGKGGPILTGKVEIKPGVWLTVIGRPEDFTAEPESLPEEPPNGSVVLLTENDVLYQRLDDHPMAGSETRWYGQDDWFSWIEILDAAKSAPVRLVPDPAAGLELPVQIPDTVGDRHATVRANPDRDLPSVTLLVQSEPDFGRSISFRTDMARLAGAALLAAADAAEKAQP